MTRPICKHCGRDLWGCRCERFEIPTITIPDGPHKYKIIKGIHQLPEKDHKYRIVFKDGQYATEAIES